jgi:carbon monoxide dehydrogenase subunit G
MTVKSDKKLIDGNVEKVYDRMSNINNLSPFIGDKVQDWKATENECSFTVNAMGFNTAITLFIAEKIPNERIVIKSGQAGVEGQGGSPFPLSATLNLEKVSETSFYAQVYVDVEVPMMLSMMVKKPLQEMVDKLLEQISRFASATV